MWCVVVLTVCGLVVGIRVYHFGQGGVLHSVAYTDSFISHDNTGVH